MENREEFCSRDDVYNNTKEFEECDYTQTAEESQSDIKSQVFGFQAIYGTVTNVNVVYSETDPACIDYYDLSVLTNTNSEAHFILSGYTYFVDCFYYEVGMKIVGFYDTSLPMLLIYPPQYQIRVIALDLPNRLVKADFFNCFLVSYDNQLRLEITNNTYIISEMQGTPYCGNISNKFMIVLYDRSTRSIPAITHPNVVIVLR